MPNIFDNRDLEILDEDLKAIVEEIETSEPCDPFDGFQKHYSVPYAYSPTVDLFQKPDLALAVEYINNLLDLIDYNFGKKISHLDVNDIEIVQNATDFVRNYKIRVNIEEYNKATQEEESDLLNRNFRI